VGRAQEFGLQSARAVPGTKGALSFSADPRSLIASALKRRGNPAAALLIGPAIAQHLQALAGSVESEPDGLRGTIKLTVR
jgi:hypothetical protein